jgi:hypothetical protein
VALLNDVPSRNLRRGEVGTIVDQLAPNAWEVEFVGQQGHTYAMAPVRGEELILLHFEPPRQAA